MSLLQKFPSDFFSEDFYGNFFNDFNDFNGNFYSNLKY